MYEALCHVPFPSFTNVAPTFRAMEYIYIYDRLQVESCIVLEISGVSLWKMNVHLGIVASLTCMYSYQRLKKLPLFFRPRFPSLSLSLSLALALAARTCAWHAARCTTCSTCQALVMIFQPRLLKTLCLPKATIHKNVPTVCALYVCDDVIAKGFEQPLPASFKEYQLIPTSRDALDNRTLCYILHATTSCFITFL